MIDWLWSPLRVEVRVRVRVNVMVRLSVTCENISSLSTSSLSKRETANKKLVR